jgi:hypothetical protein
LPVAEAQTPLNNTMEHLNHVNWNDSDTTGRDAAELGADATGLPTADVRRLTFEAVRRAEAMGLITSSSPITDLGLDDVKRVMRGVTDAGIARSSLLELETIAQPDPAEVAELMRTVIAALEASPAPAFEWRAVGRVFDAESLAPLLGISVSSLRRYQAGTRVTPDDVAARLHFMALVISDLAGAYNEIGIRRWFQRDRTLLDGQPPSALLTGEWNPDAAGPGRVRELARSLATP